jgi:hypothetical protein
MPSRNEAQLYLHQVLQKVALEPVAALVVRQAGKTRSDLWPGNPLLPAVTLSNLDG